MNRSVIVRSGRLVAAIGVMLTAPAVAAQEPAGAPAPGPAKDFTLAAKHEIRLPNGMGVTFVQYGLIPKVNITLMVGAGSVNEGSGQVWLAKVMGDLMEEGTTTRSAQQIANEAADMGGSLDVGVGDDETTIGGSVLGEFAPRMVALIADVAMHPSFPDSELAHVVANRARSLAIDRSQPQSLALAAFRGALYPDHAYGRVYPTDAMLHRYTVSDVRSFYAANVGAGRAHLYVVGRFDEPATERAVREAFAAWKTGAPLVPNVPHPESSRRVLLIDRPGAVQSSLYLGLPVPDASSADYTKLQVTDALLGGAFSSRITTNIRERKGYTYSPYSEISMRYRDAYWAEIADVTTSATGASLKEIFGEIDRLRREAPPADELRSIQNGIAGRFVLRNSSRSGIIGVLDFVRLHGLSDDYLTSYVKRTYAVSPTDVQRMAEQYLDPAKMTIVVVGDKKAIMDQLRPYGEITELK